MGNLTNNFSSEEVACSHCGIERMNLRTVNMFQRIRDYLQRAVYVYSGCRCVFWNKQVGGVEYSSHVFTEEKESCAGDLSLVPESEKRPMTNEELFMLQRAAQEAGFNRLGIHRRFLHVDDDPEKPKNRMWLY